MKTGRTLLAVAAFLAATAAMAQKPRWVGNTPQELNPTYKFVEVVSEGATLSEARAKAKDQLTDDEQLISGVSVYRKTKHQTQIDKQRIDGGALQGVRKDHIVVDMTIDGEQLHLQANRIDEYAKRDGNGYRLHTLYQVAMDDDPVFDRTYLSTSYGVAPVLASVIPGVGQWIKGSKAKGAVLFGAVAACTAGIIWSDNERASYKKKIKEQPKFAQDYNTKMDQWTTTRNVLIGAAAAVWLYNIIDAAAAKGVRKVVVQRADGGGWSLLPAFGKDHAALTLAYRF